MQIWWHGDLQALCQEWEAKPLSDKQFEPFYNAVKAIVSSSGIKLKTRVQVLSMVRMPLFYCYTRLFVFCILEHTKWN